MARRSARFPAVLLIAFLAAARCQRHAPSSDAPRESATASGASAEVPPGSAAGDEPSAAPAVPPSPDPTPQPSVPIPDRARGIFSAADALELLVLDPTGGAPQGPNTLSIPVGSTPLRFAIIASAVVKDPGEMALVRRAMAAEMLQKPSAGSCFKPIHAVRGRHQHDTAMVVISYDCASAYVLATGSKPTLMGAPRLGGRYFNEIVGERGVPVAGSASPPGQ